MTWWQYVVRTAGTDSPKVLSDATGIDPPSFSKWKRGQVPKAETVVHFARSFKRPVTEAFIAAGWVTADEVNARPQLPPDPDQLSDDDLLRILRERLNRGGEERERSAPTKQGQAGRSVTRLADVQYPDLNIEVSDLDDEVAPAAKHGVIEESGEFNT